MKLTKPGFSRVYFKYGIYAILLVIFFVWQNTPHCTLSIFGIRPLLVVPFVVCLSMFESESVAAVYGAVGGLLLDMASNRLLGFNALVLMACAVACSLLVHNLLLGNIMTAVLLCGGTLLLQGLLEWFFFYSIWGYDPRLTLLFGSTLPIILYSLVLTPLFYYATRKVTQRLNAIVE
jgi:rod shape-determining protein MreD